MLKYNLENLQNLKSFEFYYSIKAIFIKKHEKLIKFILPLFSLSCIISSILYNPKVLALFIVLLILNQFLFRSILYFIIEPLIFIGLILFFYPLFNLLSFLIFLQTLFILIFLRLYFESIYSQTDGFLPSNFLFSLFSYKEEKLYKLMLFLIFLGAIFTLPLIYINKFFIILLLLWIFAYKLYIFSKNRPLGQIVYLENLSFLLPFTFSLLSIILSYV